MWQTKAASSPSLRNARLNAPSCLVSPIARITSSLARTTYTLAKRIGSRVGNYVRNRLTGETIHDTGCSLKIMRADMLKRIKMFRGLHRFLPTLMRMEGARVVEVKVGHRPRIHGVSKYTNYRRAIEGFYDLLSVRWMLRRYVDIRVEKV